MVNPYRIVRPYRPYRLLQSRITIEPAHHAGGSIPCPPKPARTALLEPARGDCIIRAAYRALQPERARDDGPRRARPHEERSVTRTNRPSPPRRWMDYAVVSADTKPPRRMSDDRSRARWEAVATGHRDGGDITHARTSRTARTRSWSCQNRATGRGRRTAWHRTTRTRGADIRRLGGANSEARGSSACWPGT